MLKKLTFLVLMYAPISFVCAYEYCGRLPRNSAAYYSCEALNKQEQADRERRREAAEMRETLNEIRNERRLREREERLRRYLEEDRRKDSLIERDRHSGVSQRGKEESLAEERLPGVMDISGAPWGKHYLLIDQAGRAYQPSDFRGKVTVLYFGSITNLDTRDGFLNRLSNVRKNLGEHNQKLQAVFVILDSAHNSLRASENSLASLGPDLVLLHGNEKEIKVAAQEFRVFYREVPVGRNSPASFKSMIEHTTFTYIFDKAGDLRLLSPHDVSEDVFAWELKKLILE